MIRPAPPALSIKQQYRRATALATVLANAPHYDPESVRCIMVLVIELGLEEELAKACEAPVEMFTNWADGKAPFGSNKELSESMTVEVLKATRLLLPALIDLKQAESTQR